MDEYCALNLYIVVKVLTWLCNSSISLSIHRPVKPAYKCKLIAASYAVTHKYRCGVSSVDIIYMLLIICYLLCILVRRCTPLYPTRSQMQAYRPPRSCTDSVTVKLCKSASGNVISMLDFL